MGGIGSGGARANAGRPTIDAEERQHLSLTLPPRLIANLRQSAEQKGISISQLVIDLLENKI